MTRGSRYFWPAVEEEALEPYVQILASGKHRSALVAAKAYMAEASCPLSEASS